MAEFPPIRKRMRPAVTTVQVRQLKASKAICQSRFGRHCLRCTSRRGAGATCTAVDNPSYFTLIGGRVGEFLHLTSECCVSGAARF